MLGSEQSRRVVVLESFGSPRRMTNPYLTQLFDSLGEHVEPVHFSWRRALLGSYDVFHLHWPEVMVRGTTKPRGFIRNVMFVLVLVRLRLERKALVRTLHNAEPHEPPTRLQRAAIDLSVRWTTLWILLSAQTPALTTAPAVVAPHGHYRDWFDAAGTTPHVAGRLLSFGRLRGYKGTDALLTAFSQLDDDSLTLTIVGKCDDEEVGARIRRAAAGDDRVTVIDEYVPDDVLAAEIQSAELVVLPFARVTNSGSMLLALSLDRPVLMPRGPVTDEIALEVGPGWVITYDGLLTAATLRRAVESVRTEARAPRPDLSRRDWNQVGAIHAEAFRMAHSRARWRR